MTLATVILREPVNRAYAKTLIDTAPASAVVTIREGTRTLDQNAKLWSLLTDIARARPEGRAMSPEMWKAAFMAAYGHEVVWLPGIEGSQPFPAGYRSSRMSKAQMSDLIEFIHSYGARHGVEWREVAA